MPQRFYATRLHTYILTFHRVPSLNDCLPIDKRRNAAKALRLFRRNTAWRGVPSVDVIDQYYSALRMSNR